MSSWLTEAMQRANSDRSEIFHVLVTLSTIICLAENTYAEDFSEALWVKSTLGHSNAESGLHLLDLPDGLSEPANVDQRDCRKLIGDGTGGEGFLYFAVDDSYIMDDAADVFVTVEYFDGTGGSFSLRWTCSYNSFP